MESKVSLHHEARSADVGVQDNSADEDIKLVSICPTFLQAYLHSGSNKFMINRTISINKEEVLSGVCPSIQLDMVFCAPPVLGGVHDSRFPEKGGLHDEYPIVQL